MQRIKKPFYDPTIPIKDPPELNEKIVQQAAMNRYTKPIYLLDTVPYYGPSKPYRAIVKGPADHIEVKVQLGPLEERLPTAKNIRELTKQLNHLNERIEGPKYMAYDTKGREVYFKDPKAYFDPSLPDKIRLKRKLETNIHELRQELNSINKPTLIIGKSKAFVRIQNFVNTNKEETNEFIANSYYYPVKRDKLLPKRVAEFGSAELIARKDNRDNHDPLNIYTKSPENIRIGSLNKYYDQTDNVVVEAESTGEKLDTKYYYQDIPKPNHDKRAIVFTIKENKDIKLQNRVLSQKIQTNKEVNDSKANKK